MEQVAFRFGGNNFAFPDDKPTMRGKLVEFLSEEEDRQGFRDDLQTLMRDVRGTDRESPIRENLSSLLKEVLKDKDTSYKAYKADGDAWSDYIAPDGSTVSADEKDAFARETSLYEVFTDTKKFYELIGATSLKFGRDIDDAKMPKLDFSEFVKDNALAPIFAESTGGITLEVTIKIPKNVRLLLSKEILGKLNRKDRKEYITKTSTILEGVTLGMAFVGLKGTELLIEIPENKGIFNTAPLITDWYVKQIRKAGIRSGGFVPAGATYTTGVESNIKVSVTRYTIPIDLTEVLGHITAEYIEKEFVEYLTSTDVPLEDDEDKELTILEEYISPKEIEDAALKNDKVQMLVKRISSPYDISLLELDCRIRQIKTPKKADYSKASISEKNAQLQKAFRNVPLGVKEDEHQVGSFDFSYYSKAGQVKKDKMNDHLNEIKTKVEYLEAYGINGGI